MSSASPSDFTTSPQPGQRYKIHPWRAEFVAADIEEAFQNHLAHTSFDQLRVALTICGWFYVAFVFTDIAVLGWSPQAAILFAGRLVVAFTAWVCIVLARRDHARWVRTGNAATLVEIVGMITFAMIVWLRPAEASWHNMSFVIMLIVVYLFIPNRFVLLFPVGIAASIAYMAVVIGIDRISGKETVIATMLLLLANTFGAVAANRFHRLRRVEFSTLMSWREACRDLEAARADAELARERADLANRAKGQFLANMSHEIRTPMNAIIGLSHLCLKTRLDERQKDYLERIHGAGTLFLGVLNDILDLSKIEAGHMTLEETPFSLVEVLHKARTVAEPLAYAKGLALSIDVGDAVPRYLLGDPLRLNQVLMNLLSNAVKFTESGRITVRVDTEPLPAGRTTLVISVRDTGIGMNAEQSRHIFAAFAQSDASNTRRFGGTGLGLSISKHLVELMGGEIAVASAPAQGSEFRFSIACGVVDSLPATVAAASEALANLSGLRVLLVEDVDTNRLIAGEIMREWGVEVAFADDGQAGVDMVITGNYDIVLMDVQMPVLDGLEACRRIRASGRNLPVVAMTAHALSDERQSCAEAGMSDFVAKPFDPRELNAVLARWAPPLAARIQEASAGHERGVDSGDYPWLRNIDSKTALARIDGRRSIYEKVLREFHRRYRTLPKVVGNAISAADRSTARREVHTLKGLAATIGADELAASAAVLEAALGDDAASIDELIATVRDALDPVLRGIEQQFPEVLAQAA